MIINLHKTLFRENNFVKGHGREQDKFVKKQGLDKTFYKCDNHMVWIFHWFDAVFLVAATCTILSPCFTWDKGEQGSSMKDK